MEREWPNGARPLLSTARTAVRLGLDLSWLVDRLLPTGARAAYEQAIAPARAAYEEATVGAWAAYEEAAATARAAYEEATAKGLLAAWRALLKGDDDGKKDD